MTITKKSLRCSDAIYVLTIYIQRCKFSPYHNLFIYIFINERKNPISLKFKFQTIKYTEYRYNRYWINQPICRQMGAKICELVTAKLQFKNSSGKTTRLGVISFIGSYS